MAITLFWAGDSTVKQNDFSSFPQTGIGQAFELFLKKDIYLNNCAENGRSTKSFIDEKRLSYIDERIKPNDFLFIQFGHNDEKIADPTRYTEAYGSFQENLKKFVDVALQHQAYPVLITSLSRRLFENDGVHLQDTHLNYPQAMIDFAARQNLPIIDLCSLSKTLIESVGDEASREWFMHLPAGKYPNFPEGKEDNTHLQYAGAFAFATLIAEELRKMGGIYATILLPANTQKEDPRLLID